MCKMWKISKQLIGEQIFVWFYSSRKINWNCSICNIKMVFDFHCRMHNSNRWSFNNWNAADTVLPSNKWTWNAIQLFCPIVQLFNDFVNKYTHSHVNCVCFFYVRYAYLLKQIFHYEFDCADIVSFQFIIYAFFVIIQFLLWKSKLWLESLTNYRYRMVRVWQKELKNFHGNSFFLAKEQWL